MGETGKKGALKKGAKKVPPGPTKSHAGRVIDLETSGDPGEVDMRDPLREREGEEEWEMSGGARRPAWRAEDWQGSEEEGETGQSGGDEQRCTPIDGVFSFKLMLSRGEIMEGGTAGKEGVEGYKATQKRARQNL